LENLVGQTLNRYQIMSLLGEGGMGSVYRGYDTTLQRDVAIKVMHPHFARQPNFQERFLQEARTAARLNHPGIVQIHDFGSHRSQLYIVMKFIPGANLEEMLRDLHNHGRWIPLGEAVNLIRQVALALDYAHRQGVLHRDIKPGNIMIEPEPSDGLPYHPVVTDLGLAKLVQVGAMTQEGTSMGTPAYMSPEQALGKPTDARSDVYSLGILLYELVTGRLPFNPRTLAEAIQYHVNTRPPSARAIRPDIPDELEQVITQALQKDPSRRFQSALGLAEALRGVAQSTARVAGPPPGLSNTISLVAQYQNSLADERGPSVFGDVPSTRTSQRDRLQVLEGDQTSREIMFTPPGMTIGRDPATAIFIDDPKVSRQHAHIEYDGQVFRVVDLNSTNGTFLGGRRLQPNVPETWHPDQTLHAGGAYLRLLRAGDQDPALAATRRGQPFEVPPAGTTRMPVAEAPSYEFSSDLAADQIRAGEIGQVIIRNHGAASNFSITWISPGEALTFTPPRLQVNVDSGQEVVAEFRADPRESRLIGSTRTYPFSVQITPSTGNPQLHHGQITSRTAIPGWLIPLLLVLCLALLGLLATFSGLLFGGSTVISGADATRTGDYLQTQIAQVVMQTREAGSATAMALQGANAATLQSATRTGEVQGTAGAITASARQTGEAATAAAIQAGIQTSAVQTAGAQAGAQAATQQAGATQTAQAQAAALTSTAGAAETAAQTAAAQTAVAQTAAAQMAATQTTAAQTAAAQTAAAQTAAAQWALQTAAAQSVAQTAAAQTAAAQTAAAQWALQTAAAQSAAQTAAVQTAVALTAAPVERRAVYVYRDNSDLAGDYRAFLQSQDYEVDMVPMADIFDTNFSTYQVILIGPDTGASLSDAGNPWGDSDESQANFIAAANRPVIGLGQGGSLFFEALNLFIRYSQSGTGNGRDVYIPNPAAPYWITPAAIDIPADQVLRLYDDDSRFVAVLLSTPAAEVTPVARQADNLERYPIIQQGTRFLLWGFDASPNHLSSQGRRTLANILRNLAP